MFDSVYYTAKIKEINGHKPVLPQEPSLSRSRCPILDVHLAGYPYVQRVSTGVHDPLLSSALYLESGPDRVLLIANDVIYVSKISTARCREKIGFADARAFRRRTF